LDNCGRRPLSRTSIIERIQKARDEQFYTALKLKRKPVGCTKYTKQAVALAIAMEGTSATITLPSVAGVDGRGMCVLLDKGNQPLWVELAGENLEYLALVVKEELADGSTQRKHARASADEPFESCVTGISQAYALDCIRAVRKDSCGKKNKSTSRSKRAIARTPSRWPSGGTPRRKWWSLMTSEFIRACWGGDRTPTEYRKTNNPSTTIDHRLPYSIYIYRYTIDHRISSIIVSLHYSVAVSAIPFFFARRPRGGAAILRHVVAAS
jgi:hypothetical protein